MKKVFNARDVREIAARAGQSEKAVLRILGSVVISAKPPARLGHESDTQSKSAVKYELGFSLNPSSLLSQHPKQELLEQLVVCLRKYQRNCPLVVAWLGRGGFDPTKVPVQLTYARILHACRTAGRLRAELLRCLG